MVHQKTIGYFLVCFSIVLIILLLFVKLRVDEKDEFLCEVVHENGLDMEQCPAHQSNTSWLILVAFSISFLIFLSGAYLIITSKPNKTKPFAPSDVGSLDKEEKLIYTILRDNEGSLYQGDLIKKTEFS